MFIDKLVWIIASRQGGGMWGSITLVTSGFALAAFLAAAIVKIFAIKTRERGYIIRSASESDRADLVQDALEFFRVNVNNLPKNKQYEIVLEQIRARAARFNYAAIVICFLAALAAGVSVFAMSRPHLSPPNPIPSSNADTELPSSTSALSHTPKEQTETAKPVTIASCRDISHGIDFYRSIEIKEHVGTWQGGGSSQVPYCNSILGVLRGQHSERKYDVVSSREESRHDLFRRVSYRYFCTINEQEPVYKYRPGPECESDKSNPLAGDKP